MKKVVVKLMEKEGTVLFIVKEGNCERRILVGVNGEMDADTLNALDDAGLVKADAIQAMIVLANKLGRVEITF